MTDLVVVIRYYLEKMLKDVHGMKVLLLDGDTTQIVSTTYSQSEILEQEVYLVERLDSDSTEPLLHLKVRQLERYPPSLPEITLHNVSCGQGHIFVSHVPPFELEQFGIVIQELVCHAS
jgi:hypothetical protein